MPYLIIAAVILVVIAIWWIATSNNFKRMRNKINEARSGIEIALTKRYDMLTKLLDVAKGYAKHENELFSEVIRLRRGMTGSEINEANAKMDKMKESIVLTAEAYPELRSSELFRELQAGIRDSEEHLQAARRLYNSNVTSYNTSIDIFPSSLIAKASGAVKEELFVAEEKKLQDVEMKF